MSDVVKRAKTPDEALQALMRLCARAERASGDALRLLARWGVEPAARPRIVETLCRERFIDDARYAAAYVREKSRLTGWGPYKIRQALYTKGIPHSVVDRALAAELDPSPDRLAARLRTKASTLEGAAPRRMEKLIRYGVSLGYPFDEVVEEARTLIVHDED